MAGDPRRRRVRPRTPLGSAAGGELGRRRPQRSRRHRWIIAFAHFLQAQDDLWRKINQDALAATLGVGWVVGFGYLAADGAGIVSHDLNIALFPALLGVVYAIAVLVGWIRYR
ncbi:hypothetical protein BJF78_05755 [Pseudonocardia sp. CNS-139]|nr:hypothetical protein BJF78_05755 [Pseudonocardia sp. CNS-139]